MTKKAILYLLDAYFYIYRAFYAIQSLKTKQGIPTNAVYGFLQTLFKILNKARPEYLGIVYDSKKPTFRHNLYHNYKANRPPLKSSLKIQLSLIRELITTLELAAIELEGFEADDLIATLTRQAVEQKFQVVLISGDKDLYQLLKKDYVTIWNTKKNIKLDYEIIKQKLGINPDLLVDYMALTGDKVDNIPGIPGIGPKTAAYLINTYKNLDQLLEKSEILTEKKIKDNLIKNHKQILLSRKLVRLKDNAPIVFDPEFFKIYKPDTKLVTDLLSKLELTKFLKQLNNSTLFTYSSKN